MEKVNLPSNSEYFAIYTRPANQRNFWEALMCVNSDNNPKLGPEYPDPAAGNCGNNDALTQCPTAVAEPATPSQYQFQSLIRIQRSGATTSVPLTVPYPALSAECSDQFQVGYLLPIPAGAADSYSSCIRSMDLYDPAVQCTGSGLFTPTRFSAFTFTTGQASSTSTFLNQPLTSVQILSLDPYTGVLTEVANTTTASYDNVTKTCINAAMYVNYTMYYSLTSSSSTLTPGYLMQVDAVIVVTSVPTSAGSSFLQHVRVNWVDFVNSGSSFARMWSGNPGYLYGLPILAGFKVNQTNTSTSATTKFAIERLTGGLPQFVPGPGGACSPVGLASIPFGYNGVSQCAFQLTAAQLNSWCGATGSLPDDFIKLVLGTLYPELLAQNVFLGIWGNSNTSLLNQWIQLQVTAGSTTPPIPAPSDNSCSGIITSANLEILTGLAYASNNVQRKVLYARLCFKTGTWNYREDGPAVQNFYLTFNTTFKPLPQEALETSRPAPPLVVPLPADLFYPFVTSEAQGRGGATPWLLAAMSLLALLLAWQ